MPDDPEPPRKTYGFKAREFERVNSPGGPPIDVRQLVRDAVGPDPGTTSPRQPAKPENEVHTMLQENLARANAAGLNEVVPVRRRSRRDAYLRQSARAVRIHNGVRQGDQGP